jgi:H+/Cl- antiporter ClcA
VLADYWLSGRGNYFSIKMVLFGGLVAGFFAQQGSANMRKAAIGAGIVGGLPGYLWIRPAMGQTWTSFANAWSSPLAATVLGLLGNVLTVSISAVAGFRGGIVGGWLAENVNGKLSRAVSR